MTGAGFGRLDAIFHDALECDPSARKAFLESACEGDHDLRVRVEILLGRHNQAESFLESSPTAGIDEHETPDTPEDPAGMRIGRFRVRHVIGSGGMGIVYEAQQDQPQRLAAVKVLRHGSTSPSAMKRFRHEAEILGQLHHPNIAQIFEAGTHDQGDGAQPYFAMELINGRPLIRYCEAGTLSTKARLELFVKVCDAVQYAHHQGVIHRDLKPDNILVDGFGEPKILDFGIARATGTDLKATTLRTDIGQLIGTVPYMSPEQVTGDPGELDTRSDVYSLGVVLYELMSGELPHDLRGKNIPDAVRVIREEDPRPLSSISRVFRGDIDTIVSKALEKDKDRRYQTVAELALDIRHYLADEPIVARPASTFYQLRKFARRNRALVGGFVAVMLALVLGTVVALGFAIRAGNEAAKARAMNDFFEEMFADISKADELYGIGAPDPRGAVTELYELPDRAAERLKPLSPWPDLVADIHFRLGLTYYGLGKTQAMHLHFRRAYELRREVLGEDDLDTLLARLWTAEEFMSVAAEEKFRVVAELLRRKHGEENPVTLMANNRRADNLARIGRFEQAERLHRETIGLIREHLHPNHRLLFMAEASFGGYVLTPLGQHQEAEDVLRKGLARSRRVLPDNDTVTARFVGLLMGLLVAQGRQADADREWSEFHDAQGRNGENLRVCLVKERAIGLSVATAAKREEAEAVLRDTLQRQEAEFGSEDPETLYTMHMLAKRLRLWHKVDKAVSLFRKVHAARSRVLGPYDENTLLSLRELAWSLDKQDNDLKTEECFVQLVETWRAGPFPDHPESLRAACELADWYRAREQYSKAEPLYGPTYQTGQRVFDETHWITLWALEGLAQSVWGQGRYDDGETLFRKLISGRDRAPDVKLRDRVKTRTEHATRLIECDPPRLDLAEVLAREAHLASKDALGWNDVRTVQAANTLADVYRLQGRPLDVVEIFERIFDGCRTNKNNSWLRNVSTDHYGRALIELGEYDRAEAVLLQAYTDLDRMARNQEKKLAVLTTLIELYDAWHRPDEAAEWRARLLQQQEAVASDPPRPLAVENEDHQ